jgi:hypothetical protein
VCVTHTIMSVCVCVCVCVCVSVCSPHIKSIMKYLILEYFVLTVVLLCIPLFMFYQVENFFEKVLHLSFDEVQSQHFLSQSLLL